RSAGPARPAPRPAAHSSAAGTPRAAAPPPPGRPARRSPSPRPGPPRPPPPVRRTSAPCPEPPSRRLLRPAVFARVPRPGSAGPAVAVLRAAGRSVAQPQLGAAVGAQVLQVAAGGDPGDAGAPAHLGGGQLALGLAQGAGDQVAGGRGEALGQ